MDPHNARPAYHYIIMQSLAALAHELPGDHAHRAEILSALSLGLKARNSEMVSQGVMNKDHAIETLLAVNREFSGDAAFLRETRSAEALDVLARLVSEEARRGKQPLSPGGWGRFLAFIAAGK